MAEKILNSRIVNKHDSAENWSKATNFTPKQGEIIVYDIDENYSYERIKIGDGVQNVNALPFVDDALRTELIEQINNVDTKVNEISTLVGDTSVSDQINEALLNSQADWDQTDSTKPDYIKHRTHWTEMDVVSVLDKNIPVTVSNGVYGNEMLLNEPLVVGRSYDIDIDGTTTLSKEAVQIDMYIIIGNAKLFETAMSDSKIGVAVEYPDTGENFAIAYVHSYDVAMFVTSLEGDSHNVKISYYGEVVNKLDKKYLPDLSNVSYEDYQNLTDDQMAIARTNIGAASANEVYGSVKYHTTQSLSNTYKSYARTNIGAASESEVVKHTSQTLTDAQKQQARTNIGAGTSSFSGSYTDLTNKPTIPSAQVQVDWDENNESSVSFIKNRICYFKEERSSIYLSGYSGAYTAFNNTLYYGTTNKMIAGFTSSTVYHVGSTNYTGAPKKYMITEGGSSVPQYYYILGNPALVAEFQQEDLADKTVTPELTDTGESWAIYTWTPYNSSNTMYYLSRNYSSFPSNWYTVVTTLKQLDEKFIPDTIARAKDVPDEVIVDETLTNSGQAADAKTTGDAIGNLNTLVGDTSVAEQISEATYTQSEVDDMVAAVKQFCLPKIRSITLTENNWVFSANYYYQDVPVGVCTPTSKVDLQPTYSQLATWQDDGLAFTTQSKDGIVRVWAVPDAPREDITVQISVQEVLEV